MLRVPHPLLQLEILKVIKSQVPFCGRKWRQCESASAISCQRKISKPGSMFDKIISANMKTITAIYLNCKPELRDEWLAATDIENDVEDSNVSFGVLSELMAF